MSGENSSERLNLQNLKSVDDVNQDQSKSFKNNVTASNEIIKSHQPIRTPRSEMNETLGLIHSVSSTIFEIDTNLVLVFDVEPLLGNAKGNEIHDLFSSKCLQLCQIVNFNNPNIMKEINEKTLMLNDLLKSVSDPKVVEILNEREYADLYNCFFRNNVRTTARIPEFWLSPISMDFKIDKVEEAGWEHLSLVYDIMIKFFSNPKFQADYCKKKLKKLIKSVILLFQTPDQRERQKLSTLLHCLYKALRKLRREVNDIILKSLKGFNICGEPFVCCNELLITLVSIIEGFKIPLHRNHQIFFKTTLLPMHRSHHLHLYHTSLVSAIVCFLKKEPDLTSYAFQEIISHWPFTSPTKQILLLKEMEILIEFITKKDERSVAIDFAKLLSKCIEDTNFAVSERALLFWESDKLMSLTKSYSNDIFFIVIPSIYKTALSHWCGDVKILALKTLSVLKGIDENTYNSFGYKLKNCENEKILTELRKGNSWLKIAEAGCADKNKISQYKTQISKLFIGCEPLSVSSES